MLPVLFQHLASCARNPFPTQLTYCRSFNDDQLPGLDWLQLLVSKTKAPAATHQADSVQVISLAGEPRRYLYGPETAQVRATCFHNTYALETSLADEVTIYISPATVDVTQPVRVLVNGQERYNALVPVDKAFLLRQFRARRDRQQLFTGEVRLQL